MVLAGWQPGMESLIARTAHKVSRSCSSALAETCRSVGLGLFSSNVLQCRIHADEGLDGRVPASPQASPAANALLDTPLSESCALDEKLGTEKPVYDRNDTQSRKWELVRVGISNPRQGSVLAKELPMGSACRGGDSQHLSKAVANLEHRQQQGMITDSFTFVQVLKLCSMERDYPATRRVNDCITQSGMDKHPIVANSLLNAYVRCGRLQDARRVFDGIEMKDDFTWSIMTGGYAKNDNAEDALAVFNQMLQRGGRPGELLCLSILSACTSPPALKWGKEVHGYIRLAGLESGVRVGTALVQMYGQCGCITEARRVFERLPKRDVITFSVMIHAFAENGRIDDARRLFDNTQNRNIITWNIMIAAYAKHGRGVEAYGLFLQMQGEGLKPNAVTYVNILNPSASVGASEWVKAVHHHALDAGLASDVRVGNALVHMYAKCGSIADARVVFEGLETRDVMTWNILIGAYAERGCGVEAYGLFLQMKQDGFVPDAITYVSILNSSASAGALEWVREVHGHACRAGLESDLRVGGAIVHMYAKSGSIDDARLVFDRMEKRDVVTWNTMICGLALHGCGREALELFREMNANCVKPTGVSFVAALSACCHSGLLDDGHRLFLAMRQDYGIEPTVVHYNCMVDLLGRAGHLEEAMLFIDNMQVEPNGVTWRALLGACRTHGNVELGEVAFKEVVKMEPKDAAAYVALSNVYAAAGNWQKVGWVRKLMQERGVRKEPGHSRIVVKNKIHEFVVGDTSHPESKAIYAVLMELTEKLKAEGYIPDTKLVLQDIHEEDKELALCSHSEKLAIAYGLMHTHPGQPIRVYKNLRVCSDCHTATKFISKVTGREIIARDVNRFHHFKDGLCSCGDYW